MSFRSMRYHPFVRVLGPAVSAAVLAMPISAAAQDGPPPPMPMESVRFPDHYEATLSNGARLLVVENHEQPVVTVNLRIRSGTAADPRGKAGLAQLTASLLNKGTTTRTSEEIAGTVDFVGATLGAGASEDWTSITASSLTEFLDTALVIMSDIVRNPTFPEDELETERRRVLSALQVELSQPEAVAERRFVERLYGDHPYGSLSTSESIRSITRDDLIGFHSDHYRPGNALFVVAGDVDPQAIRDRLDRFFEGWTPGDVPEMTAAEPPSRTEREILLYHKPGAVQAVVRAGHLMASAIHPDWVKLDVAIQIVGGGGTGWLFDVLRQQKGYTYGAYASSDKRIGPSYFQAFAEVRNEVTDSAMAELFALLDSVRAAIPESDLDLAQDYITGSFPRQIETPQQVAGQLASTRLRGLPDDYLETYRHRVAELEVSDVRNAAREHLQPDRALIVVVGDATAIHDKLTPFGTVRLFDVEGKPMELADLEVRASELSFDPSILEPMTLVHSLLVQGNPVGEFTATITREVRDGREVIREVTQGGGMGLTIDEEVVFDAGDMTPISFRIAQQAGPNELKVDLRHRDGRVTGTAISMQGDTTRIDTTVVAGTLLPGMEAYAVLLADLEVGRELEVPAFNAQSASPFSLKIRVVGDTTVTVPAGEYEAYEVELTTAQGSQRLFVRQEKPHLVLRQEFAAQPIALELKEVRR